MICSDVLWFEQQITDGIDELKKKYLSKAIAVKWNITLSIVNQTVDLYSIKYVSFLSDYAIYWVKWRNWEFLGYPPCSFTLDAVKLLTIFCSPDFK